MDFNSETLLMLVMIHLLHQMEGKQMELKRKSVIRTKDSSSLSNRPTL